jgi:hypothetical protein
MISVTFDFGAADVINHRRRRRHHHHHHHHQSNRTSGLTNKKSGMSQWRIPTSVSKTRSLRFTFHTGVMFINFR